MISTWLGEIPDALTSVNCRSARGRGVGEGVGLGVAVGGVVVVDVVAIAASGAPAGGKPLGGVAVGSAAVGAVEMGLAHRAVPRERLDEAVQEEIDMIARGGPTAVVECKKLVRRVPELSIAQGFEETAAWSTRMFQSAEAAEGMAAFREKRAPAWTSERTEGTS